MNKANLEFRVGVFVLAGLAILGWLIVKAGDFSLKPGYTARFVFNSVGGLEIGSPVRLAGVPVGEVKNIQVVRTTHGDTQVEITCWISQGAFIEEDADIRINALGFFGDKYIEITPGTSGKKTIGDGGTIVGRTPVNMEKITESGNRLIQKLEHTVDNVNSVVADDEFKTGLKGTFVKPSKVAQNLEQASEDLKETMKSARVVMKRLENGEGSVGRLLKDDTIARDPEAFVKDLKAHPWKLLKKN